MMDNVKVKVDGKWKFINDIKKVSVYCASSTQVSKEYVEAATRLAIPW